METAHQGYGAIRRMAEGGLIGTLKNKLFGPPETVTEKYARQDAERAAKTKPPEPKPTPAPPANTISGYAAGTAMKEREKAAGMKKGGAITGKGTGTSDDVPIMASNGEFMIKAKAVQKIGVEALEALNAIADQPDEQESKAQKNAEGYKHGGAVRKMATGGLVEDETKAVFGLYPQVTGGSQRVLYDTENKLKSGVVATGPRTFAPALTPAPPAIVGGGDGRRLGAEQDPRTANTSPTQDQSIVAPAPPSVSRQPLQGAADVMAAPVTNAVTRTGNSYSGAPNISGDIAIQNPDGSARKQGGVITAQNNQAAENMSARYTGSAPQQVGAIRGGGTVSSVDTSAGYAQDLRDLARIDATKAEQAAGLQQQARFAQDQVLQQRFLGGNGAAGALLRNNTQNDLARRGQDQQASQQGAAQKLAQQKFGLDAQSAGVDNKLKSAQAGSAEQLLSAQTALRNPANTPAQQAVADDAYARLTKTFEKSAPPEQYAFAPGGQTVDPATGVAVTQPGVIFNKQTGEVKSQGAAKPAKSFEVGKTYTDAKGNKARWDGQNFVPTK